MWLKRLNLLVYKCMVLPGEDDATTQCLKELLPVAQHTQLHAAGAPMFSALMLSFGLRVHLRFGRKDVAGEAVRF